ncbi:MAG: hypothetical protein ABW321_28310 [Polyangiales bacterium]
MTVRLDAAGVVLILASVACGREATPDVMSPVPGAPAGVTPIPAGQPSAGNTSAAVGGAPATSAGAPAPVGAALPTAGGGAGSGVNTMPPTAAGGTSAAAPRAEEDAGVVEPPASTGTLPQVSDLMAVGPFTAQTTPNIGPDGTFTGIGPKELGQDAIKHPVFVWSNGGGIGPDVYKTLLEFIASHGIFVMSYNSTAQSTELKGAVDWVVSESARPDSPFYERLDASKIAAGGQSYGSLGAFWIADDLRLTTTVHINGGTLDEHTDVKKLVKPALFLCGDDPEAVGGDGFSVGDVAHPNCDADFEIATTPVWYGVVVGSSHTTIIDDPLNMSSTEDPLKKAYLAATVAWLRWQLASDATMKSWFVGNDCRFCTSPETWQVQQKQLQ